jgi:hypothetical protein
MHPSLETRTLILAYVDDAHNVGCRIRLVGEQTSRPARYSEAIQQHGVVIRAGHVVVADASGETPVVIWRIGTCASVDSLEGTQVTFNLGYRRIAAVLNDRRPDEERRARPLAVGDAVLLQGSPIEQAAIIDLLVGGEIAHPDRLRAQLDRIAAWHGA